MWEVTEMKDHGIYGGLPAFPEHIAQAKVTARTYEAHRNALLVAHMVLFKKDRPTLEN